MKLEEKLFGRLCVCVCVCFPATLLIKDGRMTRGSSWSGCWVRWSRHYLFIRWHFFFWERESFPLSAMYLPQYIGESWRHSRTCWTFSFVPLMRWPKLGGGGEIFWPNANRSLSFIRSVLQLLCLETAAVAPRTFNDLPPSSRSICWSRSFLCTKYLQYSHRVHGEGGGEGKTIIGLIAQVLSLTLSTGSNRAQFDAKTVDCWPIPYHIETQER